MKKKCTLAILILIVSLKSIGQLDGTLAPFYYGVASGDPVKNEVTIWTHVTPTNPLAASVKVTWRMATDTNFTNVVASGTARAKIADDFTVKVDVKGLKPDTWYYYQFMALNKYSLTGRTHTLPTGKNVDSVRMAVFSCTNYQAGFFNAYQEVVNRNDVDVVLYLGDWIYEYEVGGFGYDPAVNRPHDPTTEAITLSDYRTRHAQYKADPQTIRLLQQFPIIAVWDDHEVADNAYKDGAENHQPATEGDWYTRLANAKQAYFEWMPVRKPDPKGDGGRLYRKFTFGKLINLNMLDTRLQGRTIQLDPSDPHFNDADRTMMGVTQRDWLFNDLNASTAKWNIIGQQVMVAPLTALGTIVNDDQWDGYPAERNRLYASFQQNSQKNFVVLTGDIHSAWANDLPLSGYSGSNRSASAGVEFVTPSVTSPNSYSNLSPGLIQLFNSHVRYVDLTYHGFLIIDVNKNRVQSDFYGLNTITSNSYTASWKNGWYVNPNEKFLRQAATATSRGANKIKPLAPAKPMIMIAPLYANETLFAAISTIKVMPNPATNIATVEFDTKGDNVTSIQLFDISGRKVMQKNLGLLGKGGYRTQLNVSSLSKGIYVVVIYSGKEVFRTKFIKQ